MICAKEARGNADNYHEKILAQTTIPEIVFENIRKASLKGESLISLDLTDLNSYQQLLLKKLGYTVYHSNTRKIHLSW